MPDNEDMPFGAGTFGDAETGDAEPSPEHDAEAESPEDADAVAQTDAETERNQVDSQTRPEADSGARGPGRGRSRYDSDDMSDAALITAEPEPKRAETGRGSRRGEWDRELSAQKIAVELKKIEDEVRRLLEDRDPKRKRRLAGTRRWLELEEDVLSLKYQDRIDEPTLGTLQRLIARRHFLFGRLRFLAHTRPTWNS